ncbi:MAG: PKD domain-containing protein [Saprospiraceae bacterium]
MGRITKYILFSLIGIVNSLSIAEARHIVGGEITYELINAETYEYEFTMRIYRDSECQNCAFLDDPAEVAIYKCGGDINCSSLFQGETFLEFEVPLTSQRTVAPPDYDCLQPPDDIGVQEGVYLFRAVLPPDGGESYHIVYQRCCRNVTINNIINPEDAGATYTVEVTPVAQDSLNSSPTFNDFPPTIICVDTDFEFDHSASDTDGDQLVYSFCSPQLGGGPLGTNENPGNPMLCDGVNPSPPCPPPYNNVRFVQPTYNPTAPLGGDPVITIDPNTGMITGKPNIRGQFVVGVCIEEYRGGVLLSTISRDFQFNVEPCEIDSEASLDADEIIESTTPEGNTEYVINLCGTNSVTFDNQSRQFNPNGQQQNQIDNFYWEFNINNEAVRFDEWEPTVEFPGDEGQFKGQLFINEGTQCAAEADVTINVFPRIVADFNYDYDTCVAGPVVFTNTSFSEGGDIVENTWSFGDGNSSSLLEPEHIYQIPGNLPATLTVIDINNCRDTKQDIINYFPVPPEIILAPSDFLGCAPATIFFNNLSVPIDETYDIVWDFGDGNMGSTVSPTHVYAEAGVYTVSLDVTSPIGCQTDTTFTSLIEVESSPTAGFTLSPEQVSSIEPNVRFTDESIDAVSWLWRFDSLGTSTLRNPTYAFRDTGQLEIRQIVTHLNGCLDTFVRLIDVVPEVRYFLPNAFTPNNDGRNDVFRGTGIMDLAEDFTFSIWNRYGELLFQTNDPQEAWNGRKNNVGELLPNGVYVCTVRYRDPRGDQQTIKGFATLLR